METKARMLSVKEFGQQFGISRSTIYRMMKDGDGPHSVSLRGRRLFPVDEVEEWAKGLSEDIGGLSRRPQKGGH